MATIVDGKRLSDELRAETREQVLKLEEGPPCLAAVLAGDDPASRTYVRSKRRACKKAGIESRLLELESDTSQAQLLEQVERLNADPGVHGILVQLPLPPGIDPAVIASAVVPEKDVDGFHPENVGRLTAGEPALYPATPVGCIEILDRYGIEIEGQRAAVLGRSSLVGRPVALLLLHRHATVTICHSRTRDLPEVVREADILVAAIGKPELVRGDWIKPGAAVIDVGFNRLAEQRVVGDVEFEGASEQAGLITPVPGGVGPLTIAMLLRNTLRAYELQLASRAA